MIDLKTILLEYAATTSHKLKLLDGDKFSIDFAYRMKDGSTRYQLVWCWIAKGRARGKDCVYFTSRVGNFKPDLNLYLLLKEAGYGAYSTVTIVSDKDNEGNPCESVVVQASPLLEHTTKESLLNVLYEVGETADILEQKYFGADKY